MEHRASGEFAGWRLQGVPDPLRCLFLSEAMWRCHATILLDVLVCQLYTVVFFLQFLAQADWMTLAAVRRSNCSFPRFQRLVIKHALDDVTSPNTEKNLRSGAVEFCDRYINGSPWFFDPWLSDCRRVCSLFVSRNDLPQERMSTLCSLKHAGHPLIFFGFNTSSRGTHFPCFFDFFTIAYLEIVCRITTNCSANSFCVYAEFSVNTCFESSLSHLQGVVCRLD